MGEGEQVKITIIAKMEVDCRMDGLNHIQIVGFIRDKLEGVPFKKELSEVTIHPENHVPKSSVAMAAYTLVDRVEEALRYHVQPAHAVLVDRVLTKALEDFRKHDKVDC